MKIKYPKETKITRISNKKPETNRQTLEMENQIERMKLQIDELETSAISFREQSNNTNATHTTYTAGDNITINNGVISATNTTYSAGSGINISNNQISADTTTLATKSELNQKQDNLTAGNNITISNGVISATGGLIEVTASDVDSEQATNGQVLTADGQGGASWQTKNGITQEQIDKLDLVYQDYLSRLAEQGIDIYYSPKTFSDYPAGTILQGYAEYDLNLNKRFLNKITSPNFVFSANDQSVGSLKLSITFNCNTAFTGTINIFNNSQTIHAEQIYFAKKAEDTSFTIQLSGLNLSSANIFYFTIDTNPKNFYIYLKNVHAELVAPNAEVINQVSAYNVDYANGKYYISDCSTGTAKIAEINVQDITSINDLTWTDTGVDCVCYKTAFNYTINNNALQIGDRIDYYYDMDCKMNFVNMSSSATSSYSTNIPMDWFPYVGSNINFAFQNKSNKRGSLYVINTSLSTISQEYFSSLNIWSFSASKVFSDNILQLLNTFYGAVVTENGVIYGYTFNPYWQTMQIGFGTKTHTYVTNVENNVYFISTFAKYYDKIVKYNYKYTSGVGYAYINAEEIGAYEEYFEGANNDYFVVKNGQLKYYKKPTNN